MKEELIMQIGRGFKGSPTKLTSVAGQEILPTKPAGWTVPYNFYTLSFIPDQDCTIIINNGDEMFWAAGIPLTTEEQDQPITSFKIKESGITFWWTGGYR
jgi:hypothetical protein